MTTFTNFNQLFASVKATSERIMNNEITTYLIDLWREKYRQTVYDRPEGWYQRTFAAYNAVTTIVKSTGNSALIQLWSDPALMTYLYSLNGEADNRDQIIDWLNNGTPNQYYQHPQHNFVGMTEEEIEKDLNAFYAKTMRKYGFNAKAY